MGPREAQAAASNRPSRGRRGSNHRAPRGLPSGRESQAGMVAGLWQPHGGLPRSSDVGEPGLARFRAVLGPCAGAIVVRYACKSQTGGCGRHGGLQTAPPTAARARLCRRLCRRPLVLPLQPKLGALQSLHARAQHVAPNGNGGSCNRFARKLLTCSRNQGGGRRGVLPSPAAAAAPPPGSRSTAAAGPCSPGPG